MKHQKIRKIVIVISLLLFPVTFYYFSPYLLMLAGAENVLAGDAIVFLLMFLVALFFGRLFCGWVCPAAGLQELLFKTRNKKANNRFNFIKFLIWAPWLILYIYIVVSHGGFQKIDFFYQTKNGISVSDAQSLYNFIFVVILIVAIALAFGKRAFCHYACWMAPFMIIGRKVGKFLKLPQIKLEAEREKCINCFECTRNCPMSLEVNEMVQKREMEDLECILCTTCADNCPQKVISYKFKR